VMNSRRFTARSLPCWCSKLLVRST
jgi:hypothetical protein